MEPFAYRDGRLHAEDVALSEIADCVGTPCYVYSRAAIEAAWRGLDGAFGARDHLVCYAVKANSNLAVLSMLARIGSGFDIVSGGELERVLRAGGDPGRVVFSGVGKTEDEMRRALQLGIYCFNVESVPELERLDRVAGALDRQAPVSLRVNPDVDARTHPYIATGLKESKFGVAMPEAIEAYRLAANSRHLRVIGVDCHIGSQLTELAPFADAVARVMALVRDLASAGIELRHVDLGGGLGIRYRDETPPPPNEYVSVLVRGVDGYGGGKLRILIEPGRAIVGNAGILLTRVEYLKHGETRNFAIVDAAMNDLLRPALYDAWHDVVPVSQRAGETRTYDVVGPVCESGDFLAHARALRVEPGDLIALCSAGAYGSSMSSGYNTRPRCPEVVVDDGRFHVARRRETVDELLSLESVLPEY
ncbi:MAG: diaminopimelate decarboxylase [Gammaproteobacteria bacterium]|nr:diaminopimelate decarboxylase [Gammaproteobacteria bacterium]